MLIPLWGKGEKQELGSSRPMITDHQLQLNPVFFTESHWATPYVLRTLRCHERSSLTVLRQLITWARRRLAYDVLTQLSAICAASGVDQDLSRKPRLKSLRCEPKRPPPQTHVG